MLDILKCKTAIYFVIMVIGFFVIEDMQFNQTASYEDANIQIIVE